MIENLRYYINGEQLLIKWNWVGVDDTARAQCRLVKRLNPDDVLSMHENITIAMYEQNRCGCTFEMPNVPAEVQVTDDDWDTFTTRLILQAPRYRLQFINDKVCSGRVTGFLGREREPAKYTRKLGIELSNQISDTEVGRFVRGWMFEGIERETGVKFYFPKPTKRQVRCEQQVSKAEFDRDIVLRIAPEVEKTTFHDMFTVVNDVAGKETNLAQERDLSSASEIQFETIKPSENGKYKIKCPYCFKEYGYSEPKFRSAIYENKNNGFVAETDDQYIEFYQKLDSQRVEQERTRAMGHVLEKREIKEVQYAGHPGKWVDCESEEELQDDVVIAVRDVHGNRSDEKVCPYCHHRISTLAGLYPTVFISMMGNTGCGKTVYLASMIHELEMGSLLPGYKFRYSMCDNERGREVRRIYNEKIAGHTPVQGTVNVSQVAAASGADVPEFIDTGAMQGALDFSPAAMPDFVSAAMPDFAQTPTMEPAPMEFSPMNFAPMDMGGANINFEPALDAAVSSETMGMGAKARGSQMPDFKLDMGIDLATNDQEPEAVVRGQALPTGTERKYIDPCIYELSGKDPKTGANKGVIIAFFDFPGEAIRVRDQLTDHDVYLQQMIEEADGYVFLFDPSSLKRIHALPEHMKREFLDRTTRGADESKWRAEANRHPGMILADFKKTFIGEAATTQLDKPVSFVISKSDVIRDYLKLADERLHQTDTYFLDAGVYTLDSDRTGLYLDEMERESDSIVDFMADEEMREACRALMHSEYDRLWFCTSSTGIAPDKNGTLYQRHGVPVHVIEPIEFILYRLGVRNAK